MTNWCTTNYELQFTFLSEMRACLDFIRRATDENNPRNQQNSSDSRWLGNFFLEAGYPYHCEPDSSDRVWVHFDTPDGHQPECRGILTAVSCSEDNQRISLSTYSEWSESPSFLLAMLNTLGLSPNDENISISYFARNNAERYYVASDSQMTGNPDIVLTGTILIPKQYDDGFPKILERFLDRFDETEISGWNPHSDCNHRLWDIIGAGMNQKEWDGWRTVLQDAGFSFEGIVATPIQFRSFSDFT